MVTVFTPTYNRAHLLPLLYKSLQNQTCKDFEWLVVDDGSNDGTDTLINKWINNEQSFPIRYYKIKNGGKMRAINYGVSLAEGSIFCGIDSDDWFYNDAIISIIDAFESIKQKKDIVGISYTKNEGVSFNNLGESGSYIDCKNYERKEYGLEADMILIFYTEIMRQYQIPVWKDEKFTPESVFIDQMALDGYYMRYFSRALYGVKYHEGGLTSSSWQLMRDNPMGYAMMYNIHMQFHKKLKQKANDVIHFISCCCLKGEYLYVFKCHHLFLALLLFFPGFLLALRRKKQFIKYCKE